MYICPYKRRSDIAEQKNLKLKTMTTIFNEGPAMQPSTQQAVRNAAANCGVTEVTAKHVDQINDDHVFEIYDEDGNYLFSINTGNDIVYSR